MPNSTILAIPQVGAAQNNKYITINNAVAALEGATQARYNNTTAGTGITISEADAVAYVYYRVSGASANFDLTFPATVDGNTTQRFIAVFNADATYDCTITSGGVDEVIIGPGEGALVFIYGNSVVAISIQAAVITSYPYDFGGYVPGLPGVGEEVFKFVAVRAITLADDFAGSYGHAGVNPTSTATFTVAKNGSTVGSIVISTGGTFTFSTTGAGVSLAAGDRLSVTSPSPQDATLSNVAFTFAGSRPV
jgi:hypothetical protein